MTKQRNAPLISWWPDKETWRSNKKERQFNVRKTRKRPYANKSTSKSKRNRELLWRCSVGKWRRRSGVRQTP